MTGHICYPTVHGTIIARKTEAGFSIFYRHEDHDFEIAFAECTNEGICIGVFDPTCPRCAPFCAEVYSEEELKDFIQNRYSNERK